MNLSALKNLNPKAVRTVATKTFGRSTVIVKKYSPEILTAVGVVGTVTSAVMASRATLKLEPIIESTRGGIDQVKDLRTNKEYTEKDYVKDLTYIYAINARDLFKLYAPSITLGMTSIACLLGAHGIMRKRNVALAAAYKTVETSFAEYRKRVVEELGLDKDRDFRAPTEKVERKNKETGKNETVEVVNPNKISGYAKFFDEGCSQWKKNPEYNLLFLRCQQNWANDLLQARGHVFLNEVYDMIGVERTQAGSVVGWVLGENGDNFIDFGIYDSDNAQAREFVNGHERSILLDFNVDGVIYDLI